MKYFEISEIFLSFIYAAFYGAIGGLISRAVRVIAEHINRILFIFSDAYACASCASLDLVRDRALKSRKRRAPRAVCVAGDLLFFFFFGIGFFVLSYYSIDGEVRLYMLVSVLFSFIICEKIIGRWFGRAFGALYDKAYLILLFFLSLLLLPLKLAVAILNKRVVIPAIGILRRAYFRWAHKNIANRKLREVQNKRIIYEISQKKSVEKTSKTCK